MSPVRKKLCLALADSSAIMGCDGVHTLSLSLLPPRRKVSDPWSAIQPFDLVDSFWNTDIKADAILSYPSLLKHLLGVIPH